MGSPRMDIHLFWRLPTSHHASWLKHSPSYAEGSWGHFACSHGHSGFLRGIYLGAIVISSNANRIAHNPPCCPRRRAQQGCCIRYIQGTSPVGRLEFGVLDIYNLYGRRGKGGQARRDARYRIFAGLWTEVWKVLAGSWGADCCCCWAELTPVNIRLFTLYYVTWFSIAYWSNVLRL